MVLIIVAAIASNAGNSDDTATVGAPVTPTTAVGSATDQSSATTTTEAVAAVVACKDTPPDASLDTLRIGLFEGRPDTQPNNDHEAEIGDCVRTDGMTAYVLGAQRVSTPLGASVIEVTVMVQNRASESKAYNMFDWSIQTPNGQVLDPTIFGSNSLSSGSLVQGGEVTGTVSFEVPEGTNYVIWKPNAFNAARGIWQVTG